MATTPYGEYLGSIRGRLRRETKTSLDVEQIIDEIDWYRAMIRKDRIEVENKPGLEETGFQGRRSQLSKLERNDDDFAKLRMEAMDLKKERVKSDAAYYEQKAALERAQAEADQRKREAEFRLENAMAAGKDTSGTPRERKARAELVAKTKEEIAREKKSADAAMNKLRKKMGRWE